VKLTSRTEYALLALVYLARQEPERMISVEEIATAQHIPAKFLEQIMLALKRARYLRSAKGRQGGYTLAKAAENITLAEIVRLFDGALAPTESASYYFYETTPIEQEPELLEVFRKIRDYIAEQLEQTTLAQVR